MSNTHNKSRAAKFVHDVNQTKHNYKKRNQAYALHQQWITNENAHVITFKDGSRASRTRSYGHDWEVTTHAWINPAASDKGRPE